MKIDLIAKRVFSVLNSLDVEEVWDNSGNTSCGYIEPYDMASEMFEATIEIYLDDLRKYQKLSKDKEAKITCMGILKGLYMFSKEAKTEFKEYVEDDPYNNFVEIFEVWSKANKDPKMEKEMSTYLNGNFPEWYKSILKNK